MWPTLHKKIKQSFGGFRKQGCKRIISLRMEILKIRLNTLTFSFFNLTKGVWKYITKNQMRELYNSKKKIFCTIYVYWLFDFSVHLFTTKSRRLGMHWWIGRSIELVVHWREYTMKRFNVRGMSIYIHILW